MAMIRKLRGKWQAAVRRKGIPPRSKSLKKRADAKRWARPNRPLLFPYGASKWLLRAYSVSKAKL